MRPRRVLVTGGAGAIGSRLVRRLLGSGHDVTVVDDLSQGLRDNVPDGIRFVHASVADAEVVESLFESGSFEWIFHLAARYAHQYSIEQPTDDLETNGRGTLLLLERAAATSIERTPVRFVYTSSSCVRLVLDEAQPGVESPYAATKLLGEHYCRFFLTRGVDTTIVRVFNSYGPGEHFGPYRGVVPRFIRAALAGEPLCITGTGDETRDFTFVEDVADGMLRAAESRAAVGKTYDLSTGRETCIRELAEAICCIANSSSTVELSSRRAWDRTASRRGDPTRAIRDFGYSPSTSIRDGLRETISWFSRRGVGASR